MHRFSGVFWFTVVAGAVSSGLLSHALVSHLVTQLQGMVTLCTPGNDTCGGAPIDGAFRAFCLMVPAGNAAAFWVASRIGAMLIEPAAADAVR
jgi:hypothetical protein